MKETIETTHSNSDLVEALKEELKRRCQLNPSYSIRSFAKALGVSPATLSQVLNRKRPVSTSMARKVAEAMGISLEEFDPLYKASRRSSVGYDHKYKPLSEEIFHLIAEWQHVAILELTEVDGFQSDPQWMARKLDLPLIEVKEAIDRLVWLKLLKRDVDGKLEKALDPHTSSRKEGSTTAARKHFQKQMFQKALQALENIPYEQRNHSGMTMAVDSKRINEAKERIKEFCQQFNHEFASTHKDQVYHLAVALFPITK